MTYDSLIKIAIAEDHAMFREALCWKINEWENCKVMLEADSGNQLLNKLNPKNLPDIILIDLRMPGLNGYETMEILHKNYPQVKCIVLSVIEENEEAMMLIIKAGGKGFISKNADTSQIKTAIHELMRNGYYFPNKAAAGFAKQTLENRKTALRNVLNEKELAFLKYIITEKTYKEIAVHMGISEREVEYLRDRMFERFGMKNRTVLAIQCMEKGLVL